jgi:sugar phosphate isomerase/epimerase
VPIRDIEVLSGWIYASGDAERSYRDGEAFAFALAEAVGAQNIQAMAPVGDDPVEAARQFGDLCDRAAESGMTVALEFMPHTDLPNLAAAYEVIDRAGRSNGGVCIDAFHLFHAGDTVDAVARLPRESIKSVQLNDGQLARFDDYERAMLSRRVACGDGEFPLAELLSALQGIGCPLGIEVFNPILWEKDPLEGAREHAQKLRALLGE